MSIANDEMGIITTEPGIIYNNFTTTDLDNLKKSEKVEDSNLTYLPPSVIFARKMYAMFGDDPDITMSWDTVPDDTSKHVIKLRVDNPLKAFCLDLILPDTKVFGNLSVNINVIPSNNDIVTGDIFRIAFLNNPAFNDYFEAETIFGTKRFVEFKNKLIQYFADDTSDPYGVETTVFEDIARDIFELPGVEYCTELVDDDPVIWP